MADIQKIEQIKEYLKLGKIVYTKRQEGKTTAIIKLIAEYPGEYVVVVATSREREIIEAAIRRECHTKGRPVRGIVFWDIHDAQDAVRGSDKKIIVDNLSHMARPVDVNFIHA